MYPEISSDRKIGRALLRTRAFLKQKQGGRTNIFCEHLPTSWQAANFLFGGKKSPRIRQFWGRLNKNKMINDKLTFLWFIILSSFEYRVSVFLSRTIRSSCFARKFGAVPFYFLLMLSNGLLNSFIHHFFGKNAIRGAVRTSLELKNNQQPKSLSLSSLRQPNRRQGERDVWTAHIRYIKSLTWLRGLRDKIANFLRLHCLAIPRRDLSTKKTKPNIETWPEILGCHVRILIYWMWAIHRVIMPSCDITD